MNAKLAANINNMSNDEIYNAIYRDHLTGALNRRALDEIYKEGQVAIIDLDSLKYVNDNAGHRYGDALICKLSDLLIYLFGSDNVFRTGGDEFVVIGADHRALAEHDTYFSFGLGHDLASADKDLNANKTHRERMGLRAARGEQPYWFGEI